MVRFVKIARRRVLLVYVRAINRANLVKRAPGANVCNAPNVFSMQLPWELLLDHRVSVFPTLRFLSVYRYL